MIITQKANNYDTVGAPMESTAMTIDEQGLEFIFKAFSDTLYSDKIGSIVREITSNCFDSHAEAGCFKPVMIHLSSPNYGDSSNGSIIFEDFGVGISPDRMTNIFRKYFSSTKRGTNNEIGGFGIGSKTPLSYVSTFTVLTRYSGIEYTYLIHRGDKTPMVDLVSKEATHEPNGTQVVIPIQNRTDYYSFEKAIKTQLRFFDNVIINHPNFTEFNKQKIYKGKHFIFRESDEQKKGGICLGKVSYPINFSLIGEREYDFDTPICLLFDIGDINVTLNREMIDYNDQTVQAIKNKMQLAREELAQLYASQSNSHDDLMEYLESRREKPKLRVGDLKVSVDGYLQDLESFVIFKPFENTPIQVPFNPFMEYVVTNRIASEKRTKNPPKNVKTLFEDKVKIFRVAGKLTKRKSLYLSDLHSFFYTISKETYSDHDLDDNISIRKETDENREKYRQLYRKVILKYIIEHSESYDKTEVPDVWLKNYLQDLKTGASLKNSMKEMLIHCPDNEGTFRQNYYPTETIEKFLSKKGKLFIYGDSSHELTLHRLAQGLRDIGYLAGSAYHDLFRSDKHGTPFALGKISRENIKILKNVEGTIHVKDFIEKYPKVLLRIYYRKTLNKFSKLKILQSYSHFSRMFTRDFDDKVSLFNKQRISIASETWLDKIIEYNNWDLDVFYKGQSLKDLVEWASKNPEYYQKFDMLDMYAIYQMDGPGVREFSHKFLKIMNPQNYYHGQKNLRRS